jgi:hypothetical protein
VGRVVPAGEDAAVNGGVQRLDPAVQDLGERGQFGDAAHRDLSLFQRRLRLAGRVEVPTLLNQAAREIGQTGFVPHAQ